MSFSEDAGEEDEDSERTTLVDGNTYITYISGNSVIRINKDDPSEKARIRRPGIRNLIVEPELKRLFYTRGSGIYSEPLDFSDDTSKYPDIMLGLKVRLQQVNNKKLAF